MIIIITIIIFLVVSLRFNDMEFLNTVRRFVCSVV